MSKHPTKTELVCAVVVAFLPDSGFEERMLGLLPQVGMLVIVDNAPHHSFLRESLQCLGTEDRILVVENKVNLGIAAALNQGLEIALKQERKWILTLDQDTECYPEMVETLVQVYEGCQIEPAVIGGNYFDTRNRQFKVEAAGQTECLEQKTVITSGSLIDAVLAQKVGGFRADYFIDQVDHEFCLRVRSHGYRVVISRKPVMDHSVGRPGGPWLPWFGVLPNHPPLRKYYIARNTAVTVVKYWRREPDWCLRRTVRLMLGFFLMATLERQRLAKIRAFVFGLMDGILLRMGPCRRALLCQDSFTEETL